ncbi:Ankyrin repeat-containing domain protein [Beauveria brongniartii RCEF 3172]|uniref:Ankyrin repeat-containing domain protein n=1 Tax=Beauveria brongniartii RCEF 3172 TaxID=1081107 RepID=A0A166WI50_9HYPO|nr:Ankyrin repeat-containing domain protein [Beauveria brongniartii RCEF 3172]
MAENRLLSLPLELLQMVASHLDDTASISRLCRSSLDLNHALERYLYRYDAVLAIGDRRCKALLATVAESTLDTDTRVSIARKSLEAGADANFCVDFRFTWKPPSKKFLSWCEVYESGSILNAAVERGCLPLVQVLVGFKADINRRTEGYGIAPIAIAMIKSWTDVFLFLLHQPTIDLSGSEKGHLKFGSVLHMAVLYGCIDFAEKLLPYVDPVVDYGPWKPLLWLAVDKNNSAMVSFLLSCERVNVNAVRKVGYNWTAWSEMWKRESTVFVWTCRYETLEMVKLLHDHSRVDVDLCDKLNEYPPAKAAMESKNDRELKVDFLIESSKCRTARDYLFRAACERGDMELARKVVRLAEDHDKKHAKNWIKKAELHNRHGLARSIREKWRDV